MENYENIYKSICRLCLCYRDRKNMVSLIDNSSQDGLSPYAKAVLTFAQISLKKEDSFPSNMCLSCLNSLKYAIHFKLITESSDNCLKRLENLFNDSDILKEKVIEYTMFKFYFPNECNKSNQSFCKKTGNLSNKLTKFNHNLIAKEEEEDLLIGNNIDDNIYDIPMLESNSERRVKNKLIYNNDDDHYDVSMPESDPEQNENPNIILDKIENLIGTNICEATPLPKIFKRKKRYLKRRNRADSKCYKLTHQQRLRQRNQIKVKSLVCSVCSKILANQLTYDHHMQRHNGCRYICEHCGKGFPVLTELQVHQVTRHGTGPYHQCSHCPFKAPRKFDLIEHERIHSGERPYTCDKCGLTFRRRGIWRKHLIYHTEKKVQCPQCPRKFFQRSEMLAHANNIHDRVYVYLCSKCGATYAKTATVRRHMTERHGIPREMQGKVIRINKGASYQEQ